MRRCLTLVALCIAVSSCRSSKQLAGDWHGYWSREGDSLLVTLNVQQDTRTGHYTATFDSDRLRVNGIPFAEVKVQGCCDISMVLRGDRTTSVFTGTIHDDSLSGVFREGTSEGRFGYVRSRGTARTFEE